MFDNFNILLGVKQGDPASPFFFNIYMDELCANLLKIETEAPIINDNKVLCLFYYFLEICQYYTVIWSGAVQYLIYLARESRYWAKRKLSPISVSLTK